METALSPHAIPLEPMPESPGVIFYPDPVKAWVYMVRCADGTLYTGWSTHVSRRVSEHNGSRGAKYTRTRRPVRAVFKVKYATISDAMKEEARIKKMSRSQKERLIRSSQNELNNHTSS